MNEAQQTKPGRIVAQRLIAPALLAIALGGCAVGGHLHGELPPGVSVGTQVYGSAGYPRTAPVPVYDERGHRDYRRRSNHSHDAVRIPPGHMPAPGQCRVWFPERPAGHQPAPGSCWRLQHRVPPGAVLVRG